MIDCLIDWDSGVFSYTSYNLSYNHDVIKASWKPFPSYWPVVTGIHWSLMDSPHIGPVMQCFYISVVVNWKKTVEQTVKCRYIWDNAMLTWCLSNDTLSKLLWAQAQSQSYSLFLSFASFQWYHVVLSQVIKWPGLVFCLLLRVSSVCLPNHRVGYVTSVPVIGWA